MLTVCEPVRLGVEHQPFNSAVITGLLAGGEARVAFLAEMTHQAAVAAAIEPGSVHMVPISLPARHVAWWRRLRVDWRNARNAFRQDTADGRGPVLFLSCTPALLLALAWLCRWGARRPVWAVLHGGLTEVTRRRLRRAGPSWTPLALGMRLAARAGVRFIVLEDVILQRLREVAPKLADRTQVLPHPVPADIGSGRRPEVRHAGPVRLALLGLATPQKGLRVFLELARTMHEQHPGVAEFHLVGRLHEDFVALAAQYARFLHGKPGVTPLPRNHYRAALEKIDYACFFFDGRHYEMTASGVILDCMALGVPVVGRRSPILDALEGRFGPIGVLCEAGGEVAAVLQAARVYAGPEYQSFGSSMVKLGSERSILATGARLRGLLRDEARGLPR